MPSRAGAGGMDREEEEEEEEEPIAVLSATRTTQRDARPAAAQQAGDLRDMACLGQGPSWSGFGVAGVIGVAAPPTESQMGLGAAGMLSGAWLCSRCATAAPPWYASSRSTD